MLGNQGRIFMNEEAVSEPASPCSKILFRSQLLLFYFSVYFLASRPALGMPLNRKRKSRSEKKSVQNDAYMNCRKQS